MKKNQIVIAVVTLLFIFASAFRGAAADNEAGKNPNAKKETSAADLAMPPEAIQRIKNAEKASGQCAEEKKKREGLEREKKAWETAEGTYKQNEKTNAGTITTRDAEIRGLKEEINGPNGLNAQLKSIRTRAENAEKVRDEYADALDKIIEARKEEKSGKPDSLTATPTVTTSPATKPH